MIIGTEFPSETIQKTLKRWDETRMTARNCKHNIAKSIQMLQKSVYISVGDQARC